MVRSSFAEAPLCEWPLRGLCEPIFKMRWFNHQLLKNPSTSEVYVFLLITEKKDQLLENEIPEFILETHHLIGEASFSPSGCVYLSSMDSWIPVGKFYLDVPGS